MRNTIIYIVVFLLFAACEKEIQFKGDITDPLVVVNGFARPDSVLEFRLTASRFFLVDADSFTTIRDATFRLYVDGDFKEFLQSQQNGYYLSAYRPKQGDSLNIEVEAPGYDPVLAGTLLPMQPDLISVDTSITLMGESYAYNYTYDDDSKDYIIDTIGVYSNYQVSVELKFRDPAASQDFYRVVVKQTFSEGSGYYEFYDFYVENIYSTEVGDLFGLSENQNEYAIYTDELFNGKEVSIKLGFGTHTYLDYQRGPDAFATTFQIQLQRISPSYYFYLKTLSSYRNSVGFFAEPIQIFSNVQNGIGLFGAYSSSVIELSLQ